MEPKPATPSINKSLPLILSIVIGALCLIIVAGGAIAGAWMKNSAKCGSSDTTLLDEWRVKTYAARTFNSSVWTSAYTSQPYHLTQTWLSTEYNAVAYLDYLIYNCGYTQANLDTYFSEENFQTVILKNYQQVRFVASCQTNQTTLYMYTAYLYDQDYLTYTWVTPDGDKRVLEFFMAFPATQRERMNQYVEELYPKLAACPQ